MLGTIDALLLGLVLFVGGHFVLSSPPLREPAVRAVGEERFRGLYAMLALASLLWTVLAFGKAPFVEVWSPPLWTRWIPNVVMPFAAIVLSYGGMPAIDAKVRRRAESAWGPVALTTSRIPFLAAVQRRVRVDWRGIGLWRPALGLLLWAALYGLHPMYAGVWPHPVL